MKPLYRVLIIVGSIVVVGFMIYLLWQKFTSIPPVSAPSPTSGVSLPTAGVGGGEEATTKLGGEGPTNLAAGLKRLSDNEVFDFWTIESTGEVYYLTPDGRILIAKDGPDLPISNQTMNALNKIEVGLTGQKILAAFGDPRSPQWAIFDVIDKAWRPLPLEIVNAAWGADNNQLVALVKNVNQLNLDLVDISKTPPNYKNLIKDFRIKDVDFTYRPPQSLIITEKTAASYQSSVWQLDLKTLNFNLLMAPERGLILNWSKDKNLVFRFSAATKAVALLDSNFQPIGTEVSFETLPQKCGASASNVFCFNPQNIPQNAVLPDDYLEREFFSKDNLFALDLDTDELTKLAQSGAGDMPALDGYHPQLLKGFVYFLNRYDNYLYEFPFSSQ